MVRAVLVVVLSLVVPSWPALGTDHPMTRATLKGLSGVQVVVEGFDEENRRAGFNVRTFQTDVELKLRMAGIKVLSEKKSWSAPVQPYLYVQVASMADEPGEIAAYLIRLQLDQGVRLVRAKTFAFAATWSVSWLGQGSVQNVRDRLKDRVDLFLNAWLSVNPKE